ncbi:ATP-binding protein [Bradyrhizobium sp.]|uniref:ATP-binding protein n=1 Tax=Bradyrhizobium sp. TaxID=376 RepID=UPI003C233544
MDFASRRGLDRRNTLQLAQGVWLKAHENFIITGLTGTGKTWLACALRAPGSKARSFRALFAYAAPVRRHRHGASRWPQALAAAALA